MSDNPRLTYQSLLAEIDDEARQDYIYDPRVQFFAEREFEKDPDTIEKDVGAHYEEGNDTNNEEFPVQAQPEMREKTRIIVIDTTLRDWTVQPDAYSNVFTFGTKNYQNYASAQVPYYFNNPTIPLDAYETPSNFAQSSFPGSIGDANAIANNKPRPFPPGVQTPAYFYNKDSNLVRPAYGWRIVLSGGVKIHEPTAFSLNDPNIQVFYYPVYDPAETRGAQIGIDVQSNRYGLNSYSFYTETPVSNITRVKLARATLPVVSLQPLKTNAFARGYEYPDAIQNKSYLYMSIDSLKGGYYGGAGTSVQKAFSALVQSDRTLYEGTGNYPGQYIDYHPWSIEEYVFDPPLSKLSNANIQLYSSTGQELSHLDNLNIVDFQVLNGSNMGKIKFYVTQNTELTSGGFSMYNTFTKNDIRIGDQIAFYTPALAPIQSDPSCSLALRAGIQLFSNNFIVTDLCDGDFVPSSMLPIVSYATSFTAVPHIPNDVQQSIQLFQTISSLISSISRVCLQQYSGVTQPDLAFTQSRTFSRDFFIPILNVNLQPIYSFEITTLEPDTKKLQKIIPN